MELAICSVMIEVCKKLICFKKKATYSFEGSGNMFSPICLKQTQTNFLLLEIKNT